MPKCAKRFTPQFVSGNNEYAIGFQVGNIDYFQISAPRCASNGYPRSIFTESVFHGSKHGLPHLIFIDGMSVDMWQTRLWIHVVADFQERYPFPWVRLRFLVRAARGNWNCPVLPAGFQLISMWGAARRASTTNTMKSYKAEVLK